MLAWFTRRPWALLVVGVAAIAVAAVLFWALGWDPNTIAASASALAALAALGAAASSSNTARDATRALSYATKPILQVTFVADGKDHPQLISVYNVSTETIARATMEWRLRDGTTGSLELGPLAGRAQPAAGMFPGAPPAYDQVVLGNPQTVSGIDQVTITYWGVYGAIGWRKVVEVDHHHSRSSLPDGTLTSGYSRTQRDVSEVEVG